MNSAIVVQTTVDTRETAIRIADTLVDNRVAACVQISGPMTSVYRWQGKVQHDEEYLLSIKTIQRAYDKVESLIQSQHEYDVPEIIVLPITSGSENYLKWLEDQIVAD